MVLFYFTFLSVGKDRKYICIWLPSTGQDMTQKRQPIFTVVNNDSGTALNAHHAKRNLIESKKSRNKYVGLQCWLLF